MIPFTSLPSGNHGDKARTIYPLVIIPLIAILLAVGALTFFLKSEAAPANTHVHHMSPNTAASTIWYFDAGSVGNGFQEYLTLQNPGTTAANVTITYLVQTNPPNTKTVQHTIPAATRQTVDVDKDLGTSPTGPHIDASAIVQVATGGPAIIAERPWYFNTLNVNSGSDAFGVVVPQKTYYFAEGNSVKAAQPGQPAYNTFVSVLNPSATLTAHAKVTFYTGSCGATGQAACLSQALTLTPHQRQTLQPVLRGKFSISVVSSDNPIVAERPIYIKDNIPSGTFTTGAVAGVGATAPGTNWLFAEGYTGTGFQEYFELANFGTAAATAQVKLEYTNGTTQTVPVTVPALGFTQFDVNHANAGHPGATSSVSAQITSNTPIVAERLMYFHFGPKGIQGTTDVVGTPAAQTTYAFAEGYTLGNFNEFLTLQNANGTAETATVTYYLTTTSFSATYNLPANSRTTINVNTTVASRGGGAVSMLVSASGTIVAERPIYFIFGTAQGGSDVIGFTGA